ncbi:MULTISPECIES: alpha/beta hydrolase [unclassified Mesorhizobium]|uniref:alpha/beta fold hydrolase n=2 Tax=Mesorhizobium TaxID=68287 RepID=UPI0019D30BA2|nr:MULTISPECIES: alpha/beta hydrolase [unclassified Mesorhizobium]
MTRTRFAQISLAMLIAISPAGASTVGPSPSKRPAAATETLVASNPAKPTIVLVHGAFADGTGWQHIIPILQRDGYTVIAVQNALTSLAEDVATTKRVIEAQKGPVVAVGHSYGGAVITGAAAGNSNVKALVYIAAFAPEAGEPIGAYTEKYPSALGSALRPDVAGVVTIDPPQFRELFANDVAAAEASVMAAAQKPIIGSAFASSVTEAAWKTIPSWYLVAQQDRAINPDLERFYAKRMGAITAEIKSSHVPFVSHPKEVARLIEQAASAPAK